MNEKLQNIISMMTVNVIITALLIRLLQKNTRNFLPKTRNGYIRSYADSIPPINTPSNT